MASKIGRSSFDLKSDLLKNGHEFSFYQVIRLLRLLDESWAEVKLPGILETDNIKIRPELSLAFPAADVAQVEELSGPKEGFRVSATFLGLYGTSSPLPTFYTVDLLDEASEDTSVSREFIDALNHRLFLLLFQCWAKYRQYLQVVEAGSSEHFERLYCLLGLGEEALRRSIPESYQLFRYIGLFTQFPRSAMGLRTLLQDALKAMKIDIVPCVKRKAIIPPDQRSFLGTSGSTLGESIYLGEEIEDRMGKFRVQIGPLRCKAFQGLLPGEPNHQKLAFFTDFYKAEPLEYDLELILLEDEIRHTQLGSPEWSRLGWDTWVFSEDRMGEARVIFQPHKGEK